MELFDYVAVDYIASNCSITSGVVIRRWDRSVKQPLRNERATRHKQTVHQTGSSPVPSDGM